LFLYALASLAPRVQCSVYRSNTFSCCYNVHYHLRDVRSAK